MIRNEDGLLTDTFTSTSWAAIPAATSPKPTGFLRDRLKLPAGYSVAWSGQYEAMER